MIYGSIQVMKCGMEMEMEMGNDDVLLYKNAANINRKNITL